MILKLINIKKKAFSLVEVLVAFAAGITVISTVFFVYSNVIKNMTILDMKVEGMKTAYIALETIKEDIRSAYYDIGGKQVVPFALEDKIIAYVQDGDTKIQKELFRTIKFIKFRNYVNTESSERANFSVLECDRITLHFSDNSPIYGSYNMRRGSLYKGNWKGDLRSVFTTNRNNQMTLAEFENRSFISQIVENPELIEYESDNILGYESPYFAFTAEEVKEKDFNGNVINNNRSSWVVKVYLYIVRKDEKNPDNPYQAIDFYSEIVPRYVKTKSMDRFWNANYHNDYRLFEDFSSSNYERLLMK